MHSFTPLPALLGGALIGLSASLLLLTHGKISGISGIVGGLLSRGAQDVSYRAWFVAGLLAAGFALAGLMPSAFPAQAATSPWMIGLAGLLVGYGTRLGNGCTSGHGICGLSRMSARSLVATLTFMVTGAITVFLVHRAGGAP